MDGTCQDTIEALLHAPDVIKALQGTLRRVKDVPRLLHRLQVPGSCPACQIRLVLFTECIQSMPAMLTFQHLPAFKLSWPAPCR